MKKDIKIAIHRRVGSFSNYWLDWCLKNNINHKIVNAYDNDIIEQLGDCDGFMWHWHQDSYADQIFARQLTIAITGMGIKVFPDFNTSWHFDDKIGQKYLFESKGLPHVKTYLFYEKYKALDWIRSAQYPVVFKLRGGAGSNNVKLIRNKHKAIRYVKKSFSSGFPAVDVYEVARQALWVYRRDRKIKDIIRFGYYIIRTIAGLKPKSAFLREKQKGYVYFQEYIPDNTYDDRLVVVGDRCFCVRRMCRENDFRASGSGVKRYDHELFPKESVKLAFLTAKIIGSQSIAMDIVYDKKCRPRIVEISYCFVMGKFYEDCDGYFNSKIEWVNERVTPQIFMIEDFIESIKGEKGFGKGNVSCT